MIGTEGLEIGPELQADVLLARVKGHYRVGFGEGRLADVAALEELAHPLAAGWGSHNPTEDLGTERGVALGPLFKGLDVGAFGNVGHRPVISCRALRPPPTSIDPRFLAPAASFSAISACC